jgi:hypothetical protein
MQLRRLAACSGRESQFENCSNHLSLWKKAAVRPLRRDGWVIRQKDDPIHFSRAAVRPSRAPRDCRAADERDDFASMLIELHSVPSRIELAGISQRGAVVTTGQKPI